MKAKAIRMAYSAVVLAALTLAAVIGRPWG